MITMPDAGTLQEINNGTLPLPIILSPAATITTIIPGLNSSSLLSLGQLCDDGCNVLLKNDKEVVIQGENNRHDGLWGIIIPSHPNNKKSIQTNNNTTTESHANIYVITLKYKMQQILSITVHIPSYTQQSPTPYIQ